MRKEKALFVIGIWIMVLPFSGFPSLWRTLLFLATGLVIMYVAYLFYLQAKKNMPKEENHNKSFVDNIGSGE